MSEPRTFRVNYDGDMPTETTVVGDDDMVGLPGGRNGREAGTYADAGETDRANKSAREAAQAKAESQRESLDMPKAWHDHFDEAESGED